MLRYIATNSNLKKGEEDKGRYLVQPEFREEFLAQRKYPDECGNNAMHFVFNVADLDKRWEYLELLLNEDIGDINGRNLSNYLPHQIEHQQPVIIPRKPIFLKHFLHCF